MLSVKDFQFTYPGRKPISYPDFDLTKGENLWLKGASGSGKSTFMHMLLGLIKPQSRGVSLFGEDLFQTSNKAFSNLRKTKVGFVAQRPLFVKSLSIKQNIFIPHWSGAKLRDIFNLEESSEFLGVQDCLDQDPEQLSLGQLQRCQLLKAAAYNYSLLLLDEPSASLDDDNFKKVEELLLAMFADKNTSIIIVSHDQRMEGWGFDKKVFL